MALLIRMLFQHARLAPLNSDWPRTKGMQTGTLQNLWILGKILGIIQFMTLGYVRIGLALLKEKLSPIPVTHTCMLKGKFSCWRTGKHLSSQETETDLASIYKKIMSKPWQIGNTLLKSHNYLICLHWKYQWSCSDLRNVREGLNHPM